MTDDREPSESAAHAPTEEPIADAPMSETEAMMADAKRRRTRALLAVCGVLVAGGIAVAVGLVSAQREKERLVTEAYGTLGRCLWGEVLAEGQTPGTRVRSGQLITMAIPENKRAEPGVSPWPMRCSIHAFGVKERLVEAGRGEGDGKALVETAHELGEALKEAKSVYAPIAPIVDRLVDKAARAGIEATTPKERVLEPPAGPTPLTVDSFEKVTPLSTTSVALKSLVAEHITDGELRLLLRESDRGPALCTLGASGACKALPETMKTAAAGLRFAGTTDEGAAPVLLGERNGKGGIFRSDSGEQIDAFAVYGANARKDGAVTLLGFDDAKESILLTRRKAGTPHAEGRADPGGNTGNGYYNLGLLWDQLVWKAVKDDRIHLFARTVNAGDELVGTRADLGMINEPSMVENKEDEEPHVTGCRTKDALIARVKGWSNQFMLFHTSGLWSFPVRVGGRGGTLTCRGSEATLTWISEQIASGGGRVIQARCESSGCKVVAAKGADLVGSVREVAPVDAAQTAAADLDGKLLFLWLAGSDGGLRMKLAPIDKIGQAPDVVLFDPLIQKGKLGTSSTLFDMRLFVRGGAAIVVLNTSTGVHAVKIGADGAFTPVGFRR